MKRQGVLLIYGDHWLVTRLVCIGRPDLKEDRLGLNNISHLEEEAAKRVLDWKTVRVPGSHLVHHLGGELEVLEVNEVVHNKQRQVLLPADPDFFRLW